jgi:hypothetical protein
MSAVTRSYSPGVAAGTNLCRPADDGRLTSRLGEGRPATARSETPRLVGGGPGRTVAVVDRRRVRQ